MELNRILDCGTLLQKLNFQRKINVANPFPILLKLSIKLDGKTIQECFCKYFLIIDTQAEH